MGSAPRTLSGEDFNLVFGVKDIVKHPDFKPKYGVDAGNDLAIFKIDEEEAAREENIAKINPICLPEPGRPQATEGVNSGWSLPPPAYFLNQFGPSLLPTIPNINKQWHYKVKIDKKCGNPTFSPSLGVPLRYPSTARYPSGLICANEIMNEFCPNAGDSGSPLMVEKKNGRYYMEGLLSYLKGCERFNLDQGPIDKTKSPFSFSALEQISENPLAYTKLSCFLPWVASQFGLSYEDQSSDEACLDSTPTWQQEDSMCRTTKSREIPPPGHSLQQFGRPDLGASWYNEFELPCIFPFYYKDKLYTSCALLDIGDYNTPVYRCPVFNITTKKNGINHF